MFIGRKNIPVLLIALLCIAVSLSSSTLMGGTYSLSGAAESMIVGGSDCNEFLNAFAVGMGVASLFGCAWCPAGAVAAKVVELFAC